MSHSGNGQGPLDEERAVIPKYCRASGQPALPVPGPYTFPLLWSQVRDSGLLGADWREVWDRAQTFPAL